ncbi:hypothetical protein KKC13_00855 [bacterium]|nr:hypothetical protein [bacterium]MBU1958944.1 hypothetical protein [bacterium]
MKHFTFKELGICAVGEFFDSDTEGFSIYSLDTDNFLCAIYGVSSKESLFKEVRNLTDTDFFTELNEAFKEYEPPVVEPMSDKAKAKNLAWNALDSQHGALSKLEYLIVSHLSYLTDITKDLGELKGEVHGYQVAHFEVLNELKESARVIEAGLKA